MHAMNAPYLQEELKAEYLQNVEKKLQEFANFLGEHEWFSGGGISFVDFVMYELLDQHRVLSPEVIATQPRLVAFLSRVEALPAIKAYQESARYMRRPINNKMAKFASK